MMPASNNSPSSKPLPNLPIVQLTPTERLSPSQKYGAFYYLAIGGLVVLFAILLWFAYGVWSLRDIWKNVYILHDPARTEVERVNAALALSRNPDATQRQLYDISLRTDLPPLSRYLVAEALTSEAMTGSPRAYAVAVARSEGWPDWLRLLHLRPLAYGAGDGEAIHQESLRELTEHADPILRLWAFYTLAASSPENRFPLDALLAEAETGPHADLARILLEALDADSPRRDALLDQATQWLRSHHPEALEIWSDWELQEDRLART